MCNRMKQRSNNLFVTLLPFLQHLRGGLHLSLSPRLLAPPSSSCCHLEISHSAPHWRTSKILKCSSRSDAEVFFWPTCPKEARHTNQVEAGLYKCSFIFIIHLVNLFWPRSLSREGVSNFDNKTKKTKYLIFTTGHKNVFKLTISSVQNSKH